MQGMEWQEVEKLGFALIRQAETEFSYTHQTAVHPDARLCMHEYKKDIGKKENATDFSRTKFSTTGSGDIAKFNKAMALQGRSSSNAWENTQIKPEGGECYQKLKDKIAVLNTVKGKLENTASGQRH